MRGYLPDEIMSGLITVYSGCGVYEERTVETFGEIIQYLTDTRRILYECPSEHIIKLLDKFGKSIIRDPSLSRVPGLPYLSLWLREENIRSLYLTNFGSIPASGDIITISSRLGMFSVPRGIVCHWIAGNVPVLGIFSLVLATLGKNASILKIPPELGRTFNLLLKGLEETVLFVEGDEVTGSIIARSVALVSFPSSNHQISEAFSLAADCRVVYGSEEAVSAISRLPHQVHCESIMYGPKYSLAVFDQVSKCSADFPDLLEGLARDIVLFNQTACSSPHVVFCEKGGFGIRKVAELLKIAFERISGHLYHPLAEGTVIAVINTRAQYLLDVHKDILCSSDLKWTICMNDDLSLEEPVQGRCIFLKEVDDINQVLDLITRKVQTVSLSVRDELRRESFVQELAYRGVDRVMTPGMMHEYTQPWDGILGAERMVRWIAVRR